MRRPDHTRKVNSARFQNRPSAAQTQSRSRRKPRPLYPRNRRTSLLPRGQRRNRYQKKWMKLYPLAPVCTHTRLGPQHRVLCPCFKCSVLYGYMARASGYIKLLSIYVPS